MSHKVGKYSETALNEMLNDFIDYGQYTPDMPKIMSERNHLIFVYGTLKRKEKRHKIISDNCEFIGNAVTCVRGYQMYNYNPGGYPIAIMVGRADGQKTASIYGEVYLVPSSMIPVLDNIEANGEMFHRVKTYVTMSSNKYTKRPTLGCWMYSGIKRFWDTALDSVHFTPVPIIKPTDSSLPDFYEYKG